MKVNFYIQTCYISLSLFLYFLAALFLSSPRPMNSVSFHSYHATYTYLITFDFTNVDIGAGNWIHRDGWILRKSSALETRVKATQVWLLLDLTTDLQIFSLFVVFRFLQTHHFTSNFFFENIILLSIPSIFLQKIQSPLFHLPILPILFLSALDEKRSRWPSPSPRAWGSLRSLPLA